MSIKALGTLFTFVTVFKIASCAQTVTFPDGMREGDVVEMSGIIPRQKRPIPFVARDRHGARPFYVCIQGMRRRIQINCTRRVIVSRSIGPNRPYRMLLRAHNNMMEIRMLDSRGSQFIQTLERVRNQVISVTGPDTAIKARWEDYLGLPSECGSNPRTQAIPKGICPNPNMILEDRIVGGVPARAGAHPWQVSIWERRNAAGDFKQICGGVLIANCWVLSASHCFMEIGNPKAYRVRVGDYYIGEDKANALFSEYEAMEQIEVLKIISHQNFWTIPSSQNDIALLRLKSRPDGSCVTYGDFVQPICLPTKHDQFAPGDDCFITGWGATESDQADEDYPRCLQQASVRIISNEQCKTGNRGYPDDPVEGPRILDTMVCTKEADDRRSDSCQGDSGGPLMCRKGRPVVLGITSWGEGCGSHYGVYTNVSAFLVWIEENLFKATRYAPRP